MPTKTGLLLTLLLPALAVGCDLEEKSIGDPSGTETGGEGSSVGTGVDETGTSSSGGSTTGGPDPGTDSDPCAGMDLPECIACPPEGMGSLCGQPCNHEGLSCSNEIGDGMICLDGTWGCVIHPPLGPGCNAVCKSDAVSDPQCGTAMPDFPEFGKSCSSDDQCIVVLHQVDCCGSMAAVGISLSDWGPFNAVEDLCRAGFPGCECAAKPTTAEDGNSADGSESIDVACVEGSCRSHVP